MAMADNDRFSEIIDQMSVLAAESRGSFSLRYMLMGGWFAILTIGDQMHAASGNTKLACVLKLIKTLEHYQ